MKIVPARQFDLKREVEYGTPEQNEAVRRIVADIRREGDAKVAVIQSKWIAHS